MITSKVMGSASDTTLLILETVQVITFFWVYMVRENGGNFKPPKINNSEAVNDIVL